MEEVKDTLWRWYIQLHGLLGLGGATYVFLAYFVPYALRLRSGRHPDMLAADVLIAAVCVLVPGLVCFKLVGLRKWAGWIVCALLWFCVAFAVRAGAETLFWWPFTIVFAMLLTPTIAFTYALLFKPRIWHGEF